MKEGSRLVATFLTVVISITISQGSARIGPTDPSSAHSFDVAPARAPRVFTVDGKALSSLKKRIDRNPADYAVRLEQLKKEAAAYLGREPWTITKKTLLPPSGDPHDYESQGPYWWPDPNTKDGLPYIRRDGEKNPEIEKLTDHRYLHDMSEAVKTLSFAYYLTGEEMYANKAALFLRTWFITPESRMNPHLKYGQRIPGRTEGRDIGIIETRIMGDLTDAVGLLEGSRNWSRSDQKGMESWMAAYLDWLLNSEHGMGEAKQHNNHGTWYDVQVASLALFTGRKDVAKQVIERVRDERLPGHIEPDGRQPHELARTRSWSYSVMNLQSFFTLAALAEKTGIDLWSYTSPDGRSITKALDYLINYAHPENPKQWEYQQITPRSPSQLVPLLYQAGCRFPEKGYLEMAKRLEAGAAGLNEFFYPCKNNL